MEFVYLDKRIAVCIKPAGVLSTDEPGGMPELVRQALGEPNGCVRTVHRLDRVVGGLMVLARSARAASELSRQLRDGTFEKSYLDLLRRDAYRHLTVIADAPGPDVRGACLEYKTLACRDGMSLVSVRLLTGRTHQIRCQFASRGMPLAGDRKYGADDGSKRVGLWSHKLRFMHPESGEIMEFIQEMPEEYPFSLFLSQINMNNIHEHS